MIYILLVCFCVNLVSANSLAQLLLQSRPTCNQHGHNNYNLPIQPNNQPYAAPLMTPNPLSCPNNQLSVRQNGLPVQIKLDDPNQSYLTKILANPMLQNILNRNNKNNCNQNNQDNALQPTTVQAPNIINNYYIIPPECFQGKDDGIEIVKKLIGNQAGVCQENEKTNLATQQKHSANDRKNMQQSHNVQNEDNRRSNGSKTPSNEDSGSVKNQNNNNPQKRKRKNRHQTQNKGNQRNNQNRNSQNMNRSIVNKNQEAVKIIDERNLPQKRNATQELQPRKNANKKRKKPKNESKNDDINNVKQTSNDTIAILGESVPNNITIEPHLEERRIHTKPCENKKDDDVVIDIHNKFPGIPEDVIRRLIRYLRRQLQNSCENIQLPDSKNLSEQNTNTKKKRRKNKQRNQNKQRINKNGLSVADATEYSLSVPTDNSSITTTQSASVKDTINKQVDDSTQFKNEEEHTTQYKMDNEIVETTAQSDMQITKSGIEDSILVLNDDIDDYFPDFRFDKMYMSEDDYIRSLRDNRFYYTTDRSYDSGKYNEDKGSSEIYYELYKNTKSKEAKNYVINSDEIEDTLKRPDKENIEEVISKDYFGEETEFQTPPILEYPDFETKPIIKYFDFEGPVYKPEHKKADNINHKSSTYSDAKSVDTPLKKRPRNDNIETVSAGSKVAKYGIPDDHEKIKPKDPENENSTYDTVLVYAKSILDS